MTTQRNPMAGRYFNDPGFAAAVSNLAGAFAPPSADEYLTAEKVKGERLTNEARNAMFGIAGNDFDKLGIVSDLYDPSGSYYSVDTDAATARRGQDLTAGTARDVARTNAVAALGGTVLTGDEAMAGLTPEQAAAVGLPDFAPVSGLSIGAPATPLTETQLVAKILGEQDAETQRAALDLNTVQTVGANGQAVITSEADALGMDAFVNPGSQAAPEAITFERGGVRLGGFVQDGKYVDAAGVPLTPEEAGTAAKIGSPVGTNSELGITSSILTERTRIDSITKESDMLVDDLSALINSQSGAMGIAGTIQNVGQNILQVGRELGAAFGGDENAIITPEMLSSIGQPDGPHNPVFAQLRAGMLQLAYLNAQRDNPSGEVSRFSLERQIEALGQGLLANDESTLAALGMTKQANARKRAAYGTQGAATVAPAPPAATGPVSITSDADYDALPSGTEFIAPDGTTRRKP